MGNRKAPEWSLLVVAAMLAGLSQSPGNAASERSRDLRPTADATVFRLTGVIKAGSYREFLAAIAGARPTLLILDSPGGDSANSLQIAKEVNRRGMDTMVEKRRRCTSGCAVIFLSGREKFMGMGARVGLHSAMDLNGRFSPRSTRTVERYLSAVGVPEGLLRRLLATAPDDVSWLTDAELKALNVQPNS